ncbi:MAG TPA: hypothetical protein VK034_22235 [Enhygromyxa sp.]|nr:hypothetical protein [Enhygromyxa sp.]
MAGLTGMLLLWGLAWLLWPTDAAVGGAERDPPVPDESTIALARTGTPNEATQILGEADVEFVSSRPSRAHTSPDPVSEGWLEGRPTLPFFRALAGPESDGRDEDAPTVALQELQTRRFDRAQLGKVADPRGSSGA